MNCRAEGTIAAHGLCYTCYRAADRAAENPWATADKHNRQTIKAREKLMKCITRMLADASAAVQTALFEDEDADAIRRILRPYFQQLLNALPTVSVNSEHETTDVNNEQTAEPVHPPVSVNGEHKKQVNSEQKKTVHKTHSERKKKRTVHRKAA